MVPDRRAQRPLHLQVRALHDDVLPVPQGHPDDRPDDARAADASAAAAPTGGPASTATRWSTSRCTRGSATAGCYLAKRVRHMYDKGCYVRILYSFMSRPAFDLLTPAPATGWWCEPGAVPGPRGAGRREVLAHEDVRRVRPRRQRPRGLDTSGPGRTTGPTASLHADEVTLRIPSASVYNALRPALDSSCATAAPRRTGRCTRSRRAAAAHPEPGRVDGQPATRRARQTPVTIQRDAAGAAQQHHRAAAHEADPEGDPQPDQRRARQVPSRQPQRQQASGANTASTTTPPQAR